MCERWLASAISLKDGKRAIVGPKSDSVQIEGGKVRIKVFEGGSMNGRGLFRDVDWFREKASAVYPGALVLADGRGARADLSQGGGAAEIEVFVRYVDSSEAVSRRLSVANVLGLPPGVEASRPLARQPLDLELLHLQSRLRTRAGLERTRCSSLSQPAARS